MPATVRMPRAQRQQQIITVAAGLFAAYGFANVTMDEIAQHVGVTRLIIYRYFASKDDLCRTIIVQTAARLTAAMAAVATPGAPGGAALHAYITAAREDTGAFTLLFSGTVEAAFGAEIAAARRQVRGEIARQAIVQGQKEGIITDTIWLPLAADLTLALVERGTERWLQMDATPAADEAFVEYVQRAVSGMMAGIAAGRFAMRFSPNSVRGEKP